VRRNEVVHGGPFLHPNALLQQAREPEALDAFAAVNNKVPAANVNFAETNGYRGGCSL
jgi:hypothetical protein